MAVRPSSFYIPPHGGGERGCTPISFSSCRKGNGRARSKEKALLSVLAPEGNGSGASAARRASGICGGAFTADMPTKTSFSLQPLAAAHWCMNKITASPQAAVTGRACCGAGAAGRWGHRPLRMVLLGMMIRRGRCGPGQLLLAFGQFTFSSSSRPATILATAQAAPGWRGKRRTHTLRNKR